MVRKLTLVSTEDSIEVSWTDPEGGHPKFSVRLFDRKMKLRKDKSIEESTYTFIDLIAGAKYTVSVEVEGFGGLRSDNETKFIYTSKYTKTVTRGALPCASAQYVIYLHHCISYLSEALGFLRLSSRPSSSGWLM